jgi:hypothetical protein
MAKRGGKKKVAKSSESTESDVVDIGSINLRTAGPVTRLRGVMAVITEKSEYVREKLAVWGEGNTEAGELAEAVAVLQGELGTITEALETLEKSGFSPPRKSFTADTSEGDHVSILEQYRTRYEDILEARLMDNLEVLKKRDGRGGGLTLVASDGTKVLTAIAHVVRLSKPADL